LRRTGGAIEFSRRPALLVARYCPDAAEQCGGVLRLVLSISATAADDVCWIAPDKRK
jgi:hypothetical protein